MRSSLALHWIFKNVDRFDYPLDDQELPLLGLAAPVWTVRMNPMNTRRLRKTGARRSRAVPSLTFVAVALYLASATLAEAENVDRLNAEPNGVGRNGVQVGDSELSALMCSENVGPALAQQPAGQEASADSEYDEIEWYDIDYFIGGRIGYLEVEDVDEGSPVIGMIWGYHLHTHLAITGSLDYHTANYSLEDRWTLALAAGLEVYPLGRRFPVQPYAVGGVGVYTSRVERVNEFGDVVLDATESNSGYHAGGGVDITWGNRDVVLNLEARWLFTSEERDSEEVRPDGNQYTVGLRWVY